MREIKFDLPGDVSADDIKNVVDILRI